MTKYLLKIRDLSGRDFSNVLSFGKVENRTKRAREMLKADGATGAYLEDLLRQLDNSQVVIEEAMEYEYLIQYEDDDHDS